MILIGFLFYRSHAFGRPGYRIDSRTIKRGSQLSNLIESLWRAQTFAYLAYHLSCFLFDFYLYGVLVLVVILMTSQGFSKTDFVRKTCCVFGGENITGSSWRKVPHLPWVVTSPYFEVSIFCLDSPCCYLSNKIGFTSFGVHLQKLWRFSFW